MGIYNGMTRPQAPVDWERPQKSMRLPGTEHSVCCPTQHSIDPFGNTLYEPMETSPLARDFIARNTPEWLQDFPALERISDRAWETVTRSSHIVHLPEDRHVFNEQDTCEHFFLIVSGSIRVQKSSENGGVITLYHLEPGQICELTTSCLLAGEPYSADAVTESPVTLVLIPAQGFREALVQSAQLRDFVFSSLGKGVNELITLVEEVAFGQMDGRLARCLLSKAGPDNRIETTHQELAEELGSAREVISRLLKQFEHQDWVRLHRGWIEILDRDVLQNMSRHIDR
jgi:CRP/FNR family transcriptional regulator, anaerobic regulatory protein